MKPTVRIAIDRAGTKTPLVGACVVARTPWTRLIGLLNHDSLAHDEALLIEPCNSVHTFFMRFPIDVVFLDARSQVVALQSLKPWRMSKLHWKARRVLELAAGTIERVGLCIGEKLECDECSN